MRERASESAFALPSSRRLTPPPRARQGANLEATTKARATLPFTLCCSSHPLPFWLLRTAALLSFGLW